MFAGTLTLEMVHLHLNKVVRYSFIIVHTRGNQLTTADRIMMGGGHRVVVSTAAFHARVRGSVPGLGGLKDTKNVPSPSTCESQYCGEPP